MPAGSSAVENALAEVARIRAARERHLALRAEMQKKVAVLISRPPEYYLKKYGGRQLSLDLEAGRTAERSH